MLRFRWRLSPSDRKEQNTGRRGGMPLRTGLTFYVLTYSRDRRGGPGKKQKCCPVKSTSRYTTSPAQRLSIPPRGNWLRVSRREPDELFVFSGSLLDIHPPIYM